MAFSCGDGEHGCRAAQLPRRSTRRPWMRIVKPEGLEMRRMKLWMVAIGCAVASVAVALPITYDEGDLQGFPSMTDLNGNLLGKGRFSQRVDANGIHVRA